MSSHNRRPNRLADEKSPYLLGHAYNPVDWYPWGEEAFAEARRRDVPVFLSIGYSSCHWCHVMERESFEDAEVAEILNRHFISIKVDREERADVDHLYMDACMAFSGHGGWPLSAFLTPDRRPFFAGTYFPKEDRRGMTGFVSLLHQVVQLWQTRRAEVVDTARSVIAHLQRENPAPLPLSLAACKLAYEQLQRAFDPRFGGFGDAPKFPAPHNLLFLLRYGSTGQAEDWQIPVAKTLDAMAEGGIFDHIGGGFFRYSTDRQWLVPHFEKMLYDNALLLLTYAEASVVLGGTYALTAQRVADYCRGEMLGSHGGFFTAQDADSEGVEGKMYLWSPGEVAAALGQQAGAAFCSGYDITEAGNFEGKSIPNRIGRGVLPPGKEIKTLLEVRSRRVPPLKDDKVIVSSNGLMIAALAAAGRLLAKEDWVAQAEKTARFLLENLFLNKRLMARWRQGEAAHPATADDYAYLLWGLLELYAATHRPQWLDEALQLAEQMLALFASPEGGLYLSGSDVDDLPLRSQNHRDSALPSGNGVAAQCLLRLGAITGRSHLRQAAEKILASAGDDARRVPMGYIGHMTALLLQEQQATLVVAAGEGLQSLLQAAQGFYPFLTLAVVGQGYEQADSLVADASQRPAIDGKAAAYLCDSKGCRPPVTSPEQLTRLLKTI